uniref:Uncharacterized protein n=1 Tax=Arundo donax TaxID=35708 RepID=A0A0A9FH37_ARUDO
MGRRPERAS